MNRPKFQILDFRLQIAKQDWQIRNLQAAICNRRPRCSLMIFLFTMLVLVAWGSFVQAQNEEPPVAGRPEDFSGLVAFFRIRSRDRPTEINVEDPVTLTVRITGEPDRSFRSSQPGRTNLRLFSKQMKEDFFIEPVPDKDRYLEKEKTWEFVYRLRPKRLAVKRIPDLNLVYYLPARKRYQSTKSDEIHLLLNPRPEASPPPEAIEAARLPARFYELASGAAVLRRPGSKVGLAPILVVLLILPPALCALWYRRWWRWHPDTQAQQRRSQAAHKALRLLHHGPDEEQTFALVAGYLRQSLDLTWARPTPREVAGPLNRVAVPTNLRTRVSALFGACDAARFAPAAGAGNKRLADEASRLIHALEAETQKRGRERERGS